MTTETIQPRCLEHKSTEAGILARLNSLENDIGELYTQLKGKVDEKILEDLVERRTKEIGELKDAVLRLSAADVKHGEALAGIYQILQGFKETQELLRKDYSKLSECYTQSSVHIASMTAILAERARKEDEKPKDGGNSSSKDPWYVRLFGAKSLSTAITILIISLVFLFLTKTTEIFELLGNIFK